MEHYTGVREVLLYNKYKHTRDVYALRQLN